MDKKEIKIYMDSNIKNWLQKKAYEQGIPFRKFIVDTLEYTYATTYVDEQLEELQNEITVLQNRMQQIAKKWRDSNNGR